MESKILIFILLLRAISAEKISISCEKPGPNFELERCDSVNNVPNYHCWVPSYSCNLECDGLCEIENDVSHSKNNFFD